MIDKELNLRPHHGLCIQFYQGHGYDEDFTNNMDEYISCMKKDTRIRLVKGTDVLCSSCPNHSGENCISDDKVSRYDAAVLKATGTSYGEELAWGEFQEAITRNIFKKNGFDEICSDCQWSTICHKG